jgi:thioredoxin-like negative regulator of GroEL
MTSSQQRPDAGRRWHSRASEEHWGEMTYTSESIGPEEFDHQVLASPVPVVLTFGAAWCPACRILDAALSVLRDHYSGYLRVIQADIDDPAVLRLRSERLWDLGASFSVNLVPVSLIFSEGRLLETVYGPRPAVELAQLVAHWLSPDAPPPPAAAPTPVQLTRRWQETREWVEMLLTPGEVAAIDREQGVLPQVARYKAQRRGLAEDAPF